MFDGCKLILSPFTGRKKRKPWNKTREKYMPEERRQNLAETDRGSYYNQHEQVEEFLDDKGAFYNGSENDDGDNDYKNCDENMEAVVRRCSSKQMFLKISLLRTPIFTEHLQCLFLKIMSYLRALSIVAKQ